MSICEVAILPAGLRATKRKLCVRKSCVHCKARKRACETERPCSRCKRLGLECVDSADNRRGPRPKALTDLAYVQRSIATAMASTFLYHVTETTPITLQFEPGSPGLPVIPDSPFSQQLLLVHDKLSCSNTDRDMQSLTSFGGMALIYLIQCVAEYVSQSVCCQDRGKFLFLTFVCAKEFHVPVPDEATAMMNARLLMSLDNLRPMTIPRAAFDALPHAAMAVNFTDVHHQRGCGQSGCMHAMVNADAAVLFGSSVEHMIAHIQERGFMWWLDMVVVDDWKREVGRFVNAIGQGLTKFNIVSRVRRYDGEVVPLH
eukprot:TRINITY_DN7360_c0_g1_i2.p1 TRINITY_DN7360_c0_g1~~TRINITY_DN7360_c0_g1_i2.p1  ORF type:complete len:315 (-),score=36.37 TRINITY_DN7360_c0_g1_i2:188-1132(-)